MSGTHGAELADGVDYGRLANYTSASGREYWEWRDRYHAPPARVADEFLTRFPELAAMSYGQDWSYVGWYQHMLHLTYPDALPVTMMPYADPMLDHVGTIGREVRIPLPPPGFGVARR